MSVRDIDRSALVASCSHPPTEANRSRESRIRLSESAHRDTPEDKLVFAARNHLIFYIELRTTVQPTTIPPKRHKTSRPSHPFTCKRVYRGATLLLYHSRCLNFDVAEHLLFANRHIRIITVNFRAWLGLSSFFKQHWPAYDVDNLDWSRLEDVCVTFWPLHDCPINWTMPGSFPPHSGNNCKRLRG